MLWELRSTEWRQGTEGARRSWHTKGVGRGKRYAGLPGWRLDGTGRRDPEAVRYRMLSGDSGVTEALGLLTGWGFGGRSRWMRVIKARSTQAGYGDRVWRSEEAKVKMRGQALDGGVTETGS